MLRKTYEPLKENDKFKSEEWKIQSNNKTVYNNKRLYFYARLQKKGTFFINLMQSKHSM